MVRQWYFGLFHTESHFCREKSINICNKHFNLIVFVFQFFNIYEIKFVDLKCGHGGWEDSGSNHYSWHIRPARNLNHSGVYCLKNRLSGNIRIQVIYCKSSRNESVNIVNYYYDVIIWKQDLLMQLIIVVNRKSPKAVTSSTNRWWQIPHSTIITTIKMKNGVILVFLYKC